MTNTTLIIILIAFAVLTFFIVCLERRFAKDQSHLELVEMKPITDKNIVDTLKEFGATDIRINAEEEITFDYKGTPLWICTNRD